MKQKILLLFAKPYEMQTDDRGKVSGVSVRYLLVSELKPFSASDGSKGYQVAKGSLDYNQYFNIRSAPAIYVGTFTMAPNGQGKVELKLSELEYYCDLDGLVPERKEKK